MINVPKLWFCFCNHALPIETVKNIVRSGIQTSLPSSFYRMINATVSLVLRLLLFHYFQLYIIMDNTHITTFTDSYYLTSYNCRVRVSQLVWTPRDLTGVWLKWSLIAVLRETWDSFSVQHLALTTPVTLHQVYQTLSSNSHGPEKKIFVVQV